MFTRLTCAALILSLVVSPCANAYEFIAQGLYGYSTDRQIPIADVGSNGMPTGGCSTFAGNYSVLYVNCLTRTAVARVCGRAFNQSGRYAYFVNDPTVATCVAQAAAPFINQVCRTSFTPGQVANAQGAVYAFYAWPSSNISYACVSAVGTL